MNQILSKLYLLKCYSSDFDLLLVTQSLDMTHFIDTRHFFYNKQNAGYRGVTMQFNFVQICSSFVSFIIFDQILFNFVQSTKYKLERSVLLKLEKSFGNDYQKFFLLLLFLVLCNVQHYAIMQCATVQPKQTDVKNNVCLSEREK